MATVEIEESSPGDVSVNVQSDDENVNATARAQDGTVHMRAPGFRLDKDKTTGALHIRAPFARIDKSPGGKTQVDVDTEH